MTYTATVTRTGNSLALRIPKAYAVAAGLTPGQKVQLPLVTEINQDSMRQNRQKAYEAVTALQEMHALSGIPDPAAWQRELRQDRVKMGRN